MAKVMTMFSSKKGNPEGMRKKTKKDAIELDRKGKVTE
jgi:hypothetical protein